ncbi:polysaccharide biosynthesis/export family protein [Rubinisphaera sp.]|uniref:polysaccharide biosynthesis/export family protein n=1 Tax=Rubinisphaera sp. TaxID=2024857 RepID=UPI002600FAF7|nr:polysaccharide biosynthesis/export family protein [Rubinisphaera sp.]
MQNLFSVPVTRTLAVLLIVSSSGCAAFRSIKTIPPNCMTPEMQAISRNNESTIDLSLLAQRPPQQYLVDAGDVLGIYIEGVLGNPGESPPISISTNPDIPPSIGYPISIRDDGTLSLPMIGSISVRGMTIRQVEEHLRKIYTIDRNILQPGQDRIIVSLQRPREIRVLVMRQETGGSNGSTEFAQGLSINLGQTKRGNGQVVNLPIYKNDVLHALARTGGLPGLDAENTIYIIRRRHDFTPGPYGNGVHPQGMQPGMPAMAPQYQPAPFNGPMGYQPVSQRNNLKSQDDSPILLTSYRNSASPEQIQPVNFQPGYNLAAPQMPMQQQPGVQNFNSVNPLEELRRGMHGSDDSAEIRQPVRIDTIDPQVLHHSTELSDSEMKAMNPRGSGYQWGNTPQTSPEVMPEIQNNFVPQSEWNGSSGMAQPHQQYIPMPTQAPYQPAMQNQPYYQPQYQNQMPPQNWMANPESNYPPGFNEAFADVPWDQFSGDFGWNMGDPTMNNHEIIKIPVRLKPGEQPNIRPEDVLLQDGDILFIESRETEIFYTGGLLGGGQFTLPRDYDLDVLGAIAIAQGANQQRDARQIGGVSAINGDVTISASNVIILRQLPDCSQVAIKVDLYCALEDPTQRVIIQPGDIVMLRYTKLEAIGAFVERNLLESALFGIAATQIGGGGGGN